MMDLYSEPYITSEIIKGRLQWLGHVARMSEGRTVKKVFKNIPEGKNCIGKPSKKWLDDVENDVKKKQRVVETLEIDPDVGHGPTWNLEPVNMYTNITQL